MTGVGVETKLSNHDLLLFKTSARRLLECLTPIVFCDRQPLSADVRFVAGCCGGDIVDWQLIASGDFARKAEDPSRVSRAGAEILVHREVPLDAITEVICFDDEFAVRALVDAAAVASLPVLRSQRHFFSRGA